MLEIGRVCMKLAGREAGKYCVVVKRMDEGFVLVTGPKELTSVKRRRCNVNHLEPMEDTIKIKSDAADSDVLKAYQEANLTSRLGLEAGKGHAKKAEKKPATKKEKAKPEKKTSSPPKRGEKKEAPPKRGEKKEAPAKRGEKKEAPLKKEKPKKASSAKKAGKKAAKK